MSGNQNSSVTVEQVKIFTLQNEVYQNFDKARNYWLVSFSPDSTLVSKIVYSLVYSLEELEFGY